MKKERIYANEQAIPAWMKIKDRIFHTRDKTKSSLRRFSTRHNQKDFEDFKDGVASLFDDVRVDYEHDDKLQTRYPNLPELKKYHLDHTLNESDKQWWIDRYYDVDNVLWDLNITKITQFNDEDDDFAGVDDI